MTTQTQVKTPGNQDGGYPNHTKNVVKIFLRDGRETRARQFECIDEFVSDEELFTNSQGPPLSGF